MRYASAYKILSDLTGAGAGAADTVPLPGPITLGPEMLAPEVDYPDPDLIVSFGFVRFDLWITVTTVKTGGTDPIAADHLLNVADFQTIATLSINGGIYNGLAVASTPLALEKTLTDELGTYTGQWGGTIVLPQSIALEKTDSLELSLQSQLTDANQGEFNTTLYGSSHLNLTPQSLVRIFGSAEAINT